MRRQGSQFTSFAWTDRLRRSGVRISMDGKGVRKRTLDTIFIERKTHREDWTGEESVKAPCAPTPDSTIWSLPTMS